MRFTWDPSKDLVNRRKHGLSFGEVAELFTSAHDYLELYDEPHSCEEDRFIAIGVVAAGVVVVVFTETQEDVIRIISARKATRREIRLFRQYLGGIDDR